MQDVSEAVGIENMLRVVRATDVAGPQLNLVTRTDPQPPLKVQCERRRQQQHTDDRHWPKTTFA